MRSRVLWVVAGVWMLFVAGAIGWTMVTANGDPCAETVDGRTYEVECEEGTYSPQEPYF